MSILVAVLLSLITPGAGQAYNGQRKMAWAFALIDVLGPLAILLLYMLVRADAVLMAGGLSRAVVSLLAVVDAGGRAYEKNKGKPMEGPGGWQPGLLCAAGVIAGRYAAGLAAVAMGAAFGIASAMAGR